MRRLGIIVAVLSFFMAFCPYELDGQEVVDGIDAIGRFLGSSSPEELDGLDVEKLEDLLSKPLGINCLPSEKLLESGLFSQYQVASLVDYRKKHGDILSIIELGAVDGIGSSYASIIAPFLSLDGNLVWGRKDFRCDVKAKTGLKYRYDNDLRWSSGLRISCDIGDWSSFGLSYSKTFSGKLVPESLAGNLTYYFSRIPIKLIIGDFNARFGQGLALWNGMGMSGVSSPASLIKRPSGLSPSTSFSVDYSLTGLAAQYSGQRLRFSAGLALPGLRLLRKSREKFGFMPLADLSLFMANGQISLSGFMSYLPFNIASDASDTVSRMVINSANAYKCKVPIVAAKTSLSQRWSVMGVELFADISYDWKNRVPAALAGVNFTPCEALRLAGALRYYPVDYDSALSSAIRSRSKCSNEHSITFTGQFSCGRYVSFGKSDSYAMPAKKHSGTFYVDVSHIPRPDKRVENSGLQVKAGLNWQFLLNDYLGLKMKATERFRTWSQKHRAELRTDLLLNLNGFLGALRFDAVSCLGLGILGYLEGGYKRESFAIYMRTGLFFIDSWQDRIYVYERDAPGAFNVPALYGRGVWAALSGSWKFATWGKVYVRLASTHYPFYSKQKKKPGNAELKLQLNISI